MNKELLKKKTADIESGFEAYLPKVEGCASTILDAVNYSIRAGGKRLRPLFMYEAYHMFGGSEESVIRPFMMAIEMVHTYSLVHDDLPAMDNDDYRRGKLTTHKKYGEAMGVLAGDALLNMAFETACKAFDSSENPALIGKALQILGAKAGVYGMVGGQVVDVENNGKFLDEDTLFYVYKNKTSALIESSLMIGAVLAGASDEDIKKMETVGESIGLAFQIEDDILDVTGDEKTIGKPVHSDEKNEKSTYIAMHGLEAGRKKAEEYTASGLEALQGVSAKDGEAAAFLKELMLSLVGREK